MLLILKNHEQSQLGVTALSKLYICIHKSRIEGWLLVGIYYLSRTLSTLGDYIKFSE